jgi:diguanylate cyclase (GGDEF)-like protein
MNSKLKPGEKPNTLLLTHSEESEIAQKVEFEITKLHYDMVTLGGLTNIISGLVFTCIFLNQGNLLLLFGWYSALVLTNVVNILWAKHHPLTVEGLRAWRKIFNYIFAFLCLTWGSIGIFFASGDAHYQLYTNVFLLAVLIGFSFSTAIDFTLAPIGISCLLLPTVVFRIYQGVTDLITTGTDNNLNFGTSIVLFVLGSFLLIVCYIGSKLIKKFFTLSFINVTLSQKLENVNKFLEQRVTERTGELEKSLTLVKYQATHDLLTGLPNSRLLAEEIEKTIKSTRENNNNFGFITFSINELEKIVDGLGHQAGEQVLITTAQRLQNNGGTTTSVFISRKDTFVILLNQILNLEQIEQETKKLFSILDEPVFIENKPIKLTASIGISIYPQDGTNVKSLFMNADAAMLRAKQHGGNSFNIYKSEINAEIAKSLELETYLHAAIKNNEFILQYQPVVNALTGQVLGAEALVRWKSPKFGMVPPDKFISLAESNGVIIPLGEWVLRTACKQMHAWHQKGFPSLKIAVNLSAKQLQQDNFVSLVTKVLEETQFNPKYLELELTESAVFLSKTILVFSNLKKMGLCLVIDDFGTGFSGLSNIKLFDIDKLKIDKSFVNDLLTNADSRTIVTNTISLAKKLKIPITAEGVETKEQLKFLQKQNCDFIQGYYFSKPLDPDAFFDFIKLKSGEEKIQA